MHLALSDTINMRLVRSIGVIAGKKTLDYVEMGRLYLSLSEYFGYPWEIN